MLNNEDVKMLYLRVILVVTFSTNQNKKEKNTKPIVLDQLKGRNFHLICFTTFKDF